MNIVVVGGGTAGWLAALFLIKIQKNKHSVTLIESSKIGIVGAGEGSTGLLTDVIQNINHNFGCNEEDFFKETNATPKLGIRHKWWTNVGEEYVAPIDDSDVDNNGLNIVLMYALANNLPLHLSSQNGFFIENSLSSFFYEGDLVNNTKRHAYHFDAHLVGKYFKKVCGSQVTSIDSEVNDIHIDSAGNITSLLLSNGQTIFADFFIDASGFSRILSKKMNNDWISYKDHLPLNSAMPFFLPHNENIDPVTTAWAQKAGWMWMIPTQERYGCGYVFDNNFISNDEAQQEIETVLNTSIEPIRFLNFDAGRLNQLWKNNCLSIGLGAAFSEPLEATSIHTTIVQLQIFISNFLKDNIIDTCSETSIKLYNKKMTKMYDDMKNFINLHYAGGRSDSEFWKWVATEEMFCESTKEILDMSNHRSIRPYDFDIYYGHAGSALYNWILTGLGKISKNLANNELSIFDQWNTAEYIWNLQKINMKKIAEYSINNTKFIDSIKDYKFVNSR